MSVVAMTVKYCNWHGLTVPSSGMRNLMDQAVIKFSRGKPEIDALRSFNKVDELPFDFIRRRLSIVVKMSNGIALICKRRGGRDAEYLHPSSRG